MHQDLTPPSANSQGEQIAAAAKQLGVEVDADLTTQWLLAVSHREGASEGALDAAGAHTGASVIAQDAETGVFGHHVALLDFDPDDLDYFRRIARHIRTVKHPEVESAIAISGSAAQGRVQLFPGDCDFFE